MRGSEKVRMRSSQRVLLVRVLSLPFPTFSLILRFITFLTDCLHVALTFGFCFLCL